MLDIKLRYPMQRKKIIYTLKSNETCEKVEKYCECFRVTGASDDQLLKLKQDSIDRKYTMISQFCFVHFITSRNYHYGSN